MAKRPWYLPEPTYKPEPPQEPEPEIIAAPEPTPESVVAVKAPRTRPRPKAKSEAAADDEGKPKTKGRRRRITRRTMLGVSQQALGERLGLSFQQIQKQERGGNRVSASALWRISEALDVPVGFFFDGAADLAPEASSPLAPESTGEGDASFSEIRMLGQFRRLPDEARRTIAALIATMGRDQD